MNKNIQERDLHRAYFGNCIVHGNRQYEFEIDKAPGETKLFEYTIDHCLGRFSSPKVSPDHDNPERFINVVFDKDPKFVSWDKYDFEPDTLSPAVDMGKLSIGELFPLDFNGNSRTKDGKPDVGAFEWRERHKER